MAVGKVLVYEGIARSPTVNQGVGRDFFAIEGQGARHDEVFPIHRSFFDGYIFYSSARNRKYIG
jgi:hypothetical protein